MLSCFCGVFLGVGPKMVDTSIAFGASKKQIHINLIEMATVWDINPLIASEFFLNILKNVLIFNY